MSMSRRSLGGRPQRSRLSALLRRPREWRRGLDRDMRLLLAIVLIVAGSLAACLMTIREVERQLLKAEATGAAVHWAEFLQSHLLGLDEILEAGLVTEADQRIFEFAGAAGSVQDYQVIRPDGVVALSNWSGDFRGAGDSATLRAVLQENRTITSVVAEDFGGGGAIIGQAYVPLASGAGTRGALRVDVDVTSEAARYRRLGNGAFAVLIALLLPPGGLAGLLVGRNILAQRRSERVQRQRGLVLEALTRGVRLQRVLLRIARYVERHHPGVPCTIVMLDTTGEQVAACVSPQQEYGGLRGRPVQALPGLIAESLQSDGPLMRPAAGGGSVWSVPISATSGRLLGCIILRFPTGLKVREPVPEGPVMTLAQLAGFAVEARRAEAALAEMRQRNELILNAAADGIFGVDAEGCITFANPAAARILDRRPAAMIGALADVVLRPFSTRQDTTLPVAAGLADGQVRHIEMLEIRGPGGRPLPIQLVVTPIDRGLSSLCAVVVFHDISAQIAAQRDLLHAKDEAEAASRSKSSFLAHMSHELRTPLNAIIGFSEVMASETLGPLDNPRYREYVRHINSSGGHLLSLINDLLDLSKIEAGKLELSEEAIGLKPLFERCRVLVSEAAHHKGLALTLDVPEGLPLLRCDRRKLQQVLVNLLSNAVKFTPAGGQIVLAAKSDGADDISICVSDDGIGIAPEELEKVMAPFGQAREALVREIEGTGLGLPLAKALVELHGGELELQSSLGRGTTVTVRLPGRAERAAPAEPAAAARIGRIA